MLIDICKYDQNDDKFGTLDFRCGFILLTSISYFVHVALPSSLLSMALYFALFIKKGEKNKIGKRVAVFCRTFCYHLQSNWKHQWMSLCEWDDVFPPHFAQKHFNFCFATVYYIKTHSVNASYGFFLSFCFFYCYQPILPAYLHHSRHCLLVWLSQTHSIIALL